MAYPTVDKPYGFRPINRIGGNPYAGSTRLVPIVSSAGLTSAAMFNGDLVELTAAGTCQSIANGSAAPQALGVCMGVQYTNSSGQTVQAQFAPAGSQNALAVLVDDPTALFQVAVVSSGSTIAPLNRASVGLNAAVVLNTGNSTTGNSAQAIDDTVAITATLPIRIIDVVPATATGADAFVEMVVKINTHSYNNTTGI
jgi:hypothetical protein